MKHAREDYAHIVDPTGKIPADEPVFIIRGQDVNASAALDFYAHLAEFSGASPELIASVHKQAQAMRDWQVKKVPDL